MLVCTSDFSGPTSACSGFTDNDLNESRCLSFYFAWSIATTVALIIDSVDYDIAFNFLRMKVQLLLFSPNFSNFITGLIGYPFQIQQSVRVNPKLPNYPSPLPSPLVTTGSFSKPVSLFCKYVRLYTSFICGI